MLIYVVNLLRVFMLSIVTLYLRLWSRFGFLTLAAVLRASLYNFPFVHTFVGLFYFDSVRCLAGQHDRNAKFVATSISVDTNHCNHGQEELACVYYILHRS